MHDKAELEGVVTPELAQRGLALIRLTMSGSPRQPAIMVYVDHVGGVTVGECVEAARALRPVLATHFGPGRSFTVGASSPGTDRPLRTQRDFGLIVGRQVTLQVRGEAGEALNELTGPVVRAEQDGVTVGVGPDGAESTVLYGSIVTAKMKLPY
jgi:ribosome maturation factor RimP